MRKRVAERLSELVSLARKAAAIVPDDTSAEIEAELGKEEKRTVSTEDWVLDLPDPNVWRD